MDMETRLQTTNNTTWETLAAQANYCPRNLAVLCHVSLRTLQRRFAQNFGTTISDWMRNVRLTQAYNRVVAGEPIKSVAYDLGFKQLSHFSRVFKEVYGVPPTYVSPRGRGAAGESSVPTLPPLSIPEARPTFVQTAA
jgi:AraC-like DNA-binding protein